MGSVLLTAGAACNRTEHSAPAVGQAAAHQPQACAAPNVGPLRASRNYQPSQWTDDVRRFATVTSVGIPAELSVTGGNAANRTATLLLSGNERTTICRYRGGASAIHPTDPEELRRGQRYTFVSCTGGESPGDAIEVTDMTLHVDGGDSHAGATVVEMPITCPTPRPRFEIAVYMLNHVSTCFIGKPCTGDSCIGLRDDANKLVESFTDNTFQSVKPSELSRFPGARAVCTRLSMTATERQEVLAELERFRKNVVAWSDNSFEIRLHLIPIEHVELDLARWDAGLWVAPWNMKSLANSALTFVPDFNLVVQPIRDAQKRLHHDLGGCGGTFGAEPGLGVAGAGWSWVPKTRSSFFFECAERSVFAHEWLHQVHWALFHLSQWKDRFGDKLACGTAAADTRQWFPDSHQCSRDPDFARCGQRDCGGNDVVNEHIMTAHWDRSRKLETNHCRNGVRDFGETGIDTGGDCLSSLRTVASGR